MMNVGKLSAVIQGTSTRFHKRVLCLLVVAMGLSTLSACSRNRTVATVDDSAEYKNARALPPLKRPDQNTQTVTSRPAEINPPVKVEPIAAADSVPTITEPVSPATDPSVDLPIETSAGSVAVSETPVANTASAVNTVVEASLANDADGAKLIVNAGFDQAWAYLVNRLKGSEITVFSRNKTAGRIAIGCAEIGTGDEVEVTRAGGWSFFNRKKNRLSEYCSLQSVERRGATVVTVLDRAGEKAPPDSAKLILERVLK